MNQRIEILVLQVLATCMRITAAGRYAARFDFDADNLCLNCHVLASAPVEERREASVAAFQARLLFRHYMYLDDMSGSLDPDEARAKKVCDDLEGLLNKLLAFHPDASGVAA
ncbi:hypothetical protein [Marinobacter sp.]|uniref:hypothetical protein n=1 Tax=Marinobacter sp. TaxID=50741 RepID=UPI003A8F7B20